MAKMLKMSDLRALFKYRARQIQANLMPQNKKNAVFVKNRLFFSKKRRIFATEGFL